MKWAVTWQNQQNDMCAQRRLRSAWHPPNLIGVFAVFMNKAWVLSYPTSAQRRLWSDLSLSRRTLILLVLSCRGSNILNKLTKKVTQVSQYLHVFVWAKLQVLAFKRSVYCIHNVYFIFIFSLAVTKTQFHSYFNALRNNTMRTNAMYKETYEWKHEIHDTFNNGKKESCNSVLWMARVRLIKFNIILIWLWKSYCYYCQVL